VYSALEADFSALMRYINSRFTYLLLLTYMGVALNNRTIGLTGYIGPPNPNSNPGSFVH